MLIGIDARSLDVERTGIGRYLENLLREWARDGRGHCFRAYGMKPQKLAVEHRVVAFERHDQADLFSAELGRDPVDVFFSPLYELPDAVTVPSVITVHDLVHEATPEAFNDVQLDYLRKRHVQTLGRARRILTDSQFARNELVDRFPQTADRLEVVPLAADPIFCPDPQSQVRGLPELHRPFFLYVGAISEKRHLPQLLAAVQAFPDMQIVIVGRNYLQRKADLSDAMAGVSAVYRPYVPNDLLLALYRQARAFVYLSTYEGFGMPPLEAMACGTPVVVANAASLPEVVGDAAVLVDDPRDVDAVRGALHDAMADREELIRKGLLRAARFSWPRTASLTLDAIESVS